ncbi:hypothetical protein Prudu_001052 [Prunus dulcis]|uniref:Bet v I/Major latex protein domain-containing protein n=1 Tax=Prunus dulcis TaxID=3755 RepID=A0A4Y1QMN5_PRUDU|nr:hypothetical protein Prudu_001052 [Prunus dulcis]
METLFPYDCFPSEILHCKRMETESLKQSHPQAVKSAEIVEGDGGVGTIKKTNFGNVCLLSTYIVCLSDKIEKISYEIKFVASAFCSADGGSVIKNTSSYHTKGDVEIKEEHVKAGKEKAHALFKIIETYLVANPDAYN